MEFSELTSIIAIAISIISLGTSIFLKLQNIVRLKVISTYFPPHHTEDDPDSPPVLQIEIINKGNDDVFLEALFVGYEGVKGRSFVDTLWESDDGVRILLNKGDKKVHNFMPDHDGILIDDKGNPANRLFVYTQMNTLHRVRGAQKNIRAYLEVAND